MTGLVRYHSHFFISICFILGIFFLQPLLVFSDVSNVDVTVTLYECYDGIDNDSDGLTDYPNDPGCDTSNDDDETDPVSCGDGTCSGGESCSSCSLDCGVCPTSGGGGIVSTVVTSATFTGRAYPGSRITLLKGGELVTTTLAGPDARFNISVTGLSGGNYMFLLYSRDKDNVRSKSEMFPVNITTGANTTISGIFITPTIGVDKEVVKRGENIAVFGQTVPGGIVTVSINSDEEQFVNMNSDEEGVYFLQFDTIVLERGAHSVKSKVATNGNISTYGELVSFTVGDKTVYKKKTTVQGGDLNGDGLINLIDFSIGAYWYKRPLTEGFMAKESESLSSDNKIDLVDFSIMAYYWTG